MHRHAIIVIKNENDEYLQYYDERWHSYLFLNCHLYDSIYENNKLVHNYLSSRFKLNKNDFDIKHIKTIIHTKYSVTHQEDRDYEHYFYQIILNSFPKVMQPKTFLLDGITYRWYSYEELLENERIMEVNSDVVKYVKRLNM